MKHTINLLTKKEKTVFDRTVYFFLNYLRYVLVITQLVVLGVLFYRFKIDEQIVEYESSIRQKNEIMKVVSPLLERAYTVDIQMKTASIILREQKKQQDMMSYVFERFPSDLFTLRTTIDINSIHLFGTTNNYNQLQQYYKLLQQERLFEKIELSRIMRTDVGYEFELSLTNYRAVQ